MLELIYRVDCSTIDSYEDFVQAFNRGMIKNVGGNWNGNLDAFNDYLAWPDQIPYKLVLVGSDRCRQILSYRDRPEHPDTLWNIIHEILGDAKSFVDVELS